MPALYFSVGGFDHTSGEVQVSAFSRQFSDYSPTGNPLAVSVSMAIRGTVIASTPADITARIEAIEAAYAAVVTSAGLKNSDGSPTAHYMQSSQGGPIRISGPRWEGDSGDQYASGRSFSATIEQDIPVGNTVELVDYSETVSIRGNGGPRYGLREYDSGPPEIMEISEQTGVTITQSGFAVGATNWPAANGPLDGYDVQGNSAAVTYEAPKRSNYGLSRYTTRWNYQLLSAGSVSGARPLIK